jgi:hypothetical protein
VSGSEDGVVNVPLVSTDPFMYQTTTWPDS